MSFVHGSQRRPLARSAQTLGDIYSNDVGGGGDIASSNGTSGGSSGGSSGGILEQSTGAPTWLLKGALWILGVGLLVRALEPAAHAARRVARGDDRKRGK